MNPRPQTTYIRAWNRGNPSLVGRGTAPPLPRLSEGPRWIWAPRALDPAPHISTQPDTEQARHHHPAITSAARKRSERALVGESALPATATVSFCAGTTIFRGRARRRLARQAGRPSPGLPPEQTAEAKSRRLHRDENLFRIGLEAAASRERRSGSKTAAFAWQGPAQAPAFARREADDMVRQPTSLARKGAPRRRTDRSPKTRDRG